MTNIVSDIYIMTYQGHFMIYLNTFLFAGQDSLFENCGCSSSQLAL